MTIPNLPWKTIGKYAFGAGTSIVLGVLNERDKQKNIERLGEKIGKEVSKSLKKEEETA